MNLFLNSKHSENNSALAINIQHRWAHQIAIFMSEESLTLFGSITNKVGVHQAGTE